MYDFVKSRSHLLTSNTSGNSWSLKQFFLHERRWVTSMVWCLTSSCVPMSLGSNGRWMDVDESNVWFFVLLLLLLLMVQKSSVHHLRLVVDNPIIFRAFYIHPKWLFGISEPSTVGWYWKEGVSPLKFIFILVNKRWKKLWKEGTFATKERHKNLTNCCLLLPF